MAARLQRMTAPASCVTSTGIPPQNSATILKPLVPNPHSTPFTHSPVIPSLRARELGAIIITSRARKIVIGTRRKKNYSYSTTTVRGT